MGLDINVHDNWAVESPGNIFDRSTERLGTTDKAIIVYRKLLMEAIDAAERGEMVPALSSNDTMIGPVAVDTIGSRDNLDNCWRDYDRDRRERSPWASII